MPGQSRRTKRRNWNVSFHFGFWHRIPDSGKLQVLCTSHCHRKWRVESGMLHVVNMIFEFLSCRPSLALLPWHCAVILFGSASALRLYVCCQGCVNAHGLCHRAPCIYLPEYVLATALDAPNDQSEEIQFIMLLDYFFFDIPLRDDSSVRLLLWQLLLPLLLLLLDVKKVNCMLIPTAVVVASLLCNSPFPLSRSPLLALILLLL